MYCGNCGRKLSEEAKFCPGCGEKVIPDQENPIAEPAVEQTGIPVSPNQPKKGKGSKKILIGLAILAVVFLGGIGYVTWGMGAQKDQLVSIIDRSKIPEYMSEKEDAIKEWKTLGVTDFSEKKEVLEKLKVIGEDVETFEQCAEDVKKYQKEKEKYHMADSEYSDYEKLLKKCEQAVKEKEAKEAVSLLSDTKDSFKELLKANDTYINDVVDMYESLDLTEAEESEKKAYQEHMDQIKKLTEKKEKDYQAIKKEFTQMNEAVSLYIEPEHPLDIQIQQIDATDFPKIKLYMNVKDSSGKVPKNLENTMFYIKKEDANAKYVRQVVTTVNQLNELEALKIDMVADVSGSMEGKPLFEAKNIMCNFVNSVQFTAGDMVELTSFATGVRLEQEFCSDKKALINKINGLYTGDMTSLYDALYTSVERVAAQSGARCVIAFTDGNDNYSNCSVDQVISVAQRYHIPIFIIGIGSSDYTDASYIAQQTGGAYYNVNDVYSMESIYLKIYQMEKELYLVEFEDSTGAKMTDIANIEAGYHSVEYGGKCTYSYTPNILLSVSGDNIYKDGPEAVVEKYLRGYDDAITKSDFSYIADCLKVDSEIYKEQQKYILRDITEQLNTFEIVSADYSDAQNCVVTTRETYFVQIKNETLELMTQECKYALEQTTNGWKMTAFAEPVQVLSRINQ
ncbi:MAG: VWA domain-containing protein [Lachnospiraceae bacterium]|nr:VWA domain-containing protein [Lachnospiraceae bacterium]